MNPLTWLRRRREALAARIERDRQQAQWFVEATEHIRRQKQLIDNLTQFVADTTDEPAILLRLAKAMEKQRERNTELEKIEPATKYQN